MKVVQLDNDAARIAELFEHLRKRLTEEKNCKFLATVIDEAGEVQQYHCYEVETVADIATMLGAVEMLKHYITERHYG